jgi:membrane protease YdiL (CAAX protease family)
MPAYNIFNGTDGLRAGWRLLIYAALLCALGYGADKIANAIFHGQWPDLMTPTGIVLSFLDEACALLLAAWIMARIESRSLSDYGLPWRRAFSRQFWQAGVIGFVSLTFLLVVLRLARAYSLGSLQLHGVDIVKNGLLWAVAITLLATIEEFFYRGYLQFTLTSGIGFWPAAAFTSALMAAAHTFNPGFGQCSACAPWVASGSSHVCYYDGRATSGCPLGYTPRGTGANPISTACLTAGKWATGIYSRGVFTVLRGSPACRSAWKRVGPVSHSS